MQYQRILMHFLYIYTRGYRCRGYKQDDDFGFMAPSPRITLRDALSTSGTKKVDILYGSQGQFILSFEETQGTGFGPWVELRLQAPSDHVNVQKATWAGQSLQQESYKFTYNQQLQKYELIHPITKELLQANEADDLLIWKLPVGSYQKGSPPLDVQILFTLIATSPDILTEDVQVTAGGGYRYGSDPRDNSNPDQPLDPADPYDPVVSAPQDQGLIHPLPVLLQKETDAPEDETVTGPNFPKSWRLDVDIADGQTIDPLKLQDQLPADLVFLGDSPVEISPAGSTFQYMPSRPFQINPGQTVRPPFSRWSVEYQKARGTAQAVDLRARLNFYVPEVLGADGQPVLYRNQSDLKGIWSNINQPESVSISGTETEDKITARALAIQKTDDKKETKLPNGVILPGPIRPGEEVNFTLNFQVSDFFAFGELQITDLLRDGLSFIAGSARIDLWEEGRQFSAKPLLFDDNLIGYRSDFNRDGDDQLIFYLSDWLRDHATASGSAYPYLKDGLLIGGKVIGDLGATKGTITFKAKADDSYFSSDTIKSEDRLRNDVEIRGDVVIYDKKTATFLPTGDRVRDSSTEHLRVPSPTLQKDLIARNGLPISPDATGQLVFAPGDTVTYQLTAVFPTGDLQKVKISDWLPTPGFDLVADAQRFGGISSFEQGTGPYPSPGQYIYGVQHGSSTSGASPKPVLVNDVITIAGSGGGNVLTAQFADQSDPSNQTTTIQLLYSVTATSAVMTDRLSQTNLAVLNYQSTPGKGSNSSDNNHSIGPAISIGQRLSPELEIRKGIISSSRDNLGQNPAKYSPDLKTAGVVFEPVGSQSSKPFAGVLNSQLISEPGGQGSTGKPLDHILDSNISGLDAGDTVRFAIVVENIGTSYKGAFNVQLRDQLPAGLSYKGNLQIVDGTGDQIPYRSAKGLSVNSDRFFTDDGVVLIDPGPTAAVSPDGENGGAIDGYHPTSGRNIVVVTFDAIIDDDSYQKAEKLSLQNDGIIEDYTNVETPDQDQHTFLPGDRIKKDSANVTLRKSNIDKTIKTSSEQNTSRNNLTIGEIVRYNIVIDVPEGNLGDVEITDTLPKGLSYLGNTQLGLVGSVSDFDWAETVPVSDYLVSDPFALDPSLSANAWVDPDVTSKPNGKTGLSWSLGEFSNRNRDNMFQESIVIEFNALVENISANVDGRQRNNRAGFKINKVSAGGSGPVPATLVEPELIIEKTVDPTRAIQAGDKLTFQVSVSNPSSVEAFDVEISDLFGADLGSFIDLESVSTTTLPRGWVNQSNIGFSDASQDFIKFSGESLKPQESFSITYSGTVQPSFVIGTSLENTAKLQWSSLPDDQGTDPNPTGSITPGQPDDQKGERVYFAQDTAAVNSVNLEPSKSIDSTSELHTSDRELAIGELVRFRLEVTLPQGNLPDLQLQDTLPEGFEFVDDGTAKFGILVKDPKKPGITSSNGIDIDQAFTSGQEPVLAERPVLGSDGSSQTLTWFFGEIINSNTDLHKDELVVEFNARVANDLINQDQEIRANRFMASHSGGNGYRQSVKSEEQIIVEPNVLLAKTVTSADDNLQAGDRISYELLLENNGSASAFDLEINDLFGDFGSAFKLDPSSIVAPAGSVVDQNSIDSLKIFIDELPVGISQKISYAGNLTTNEINNSLYTNTATVDWTSLPGFGTTSNPTGSVSLDERTGVDGSPTNNSSTQPLNNYKAEDRASIQTTALSLRKTIADTSEVSSQGADVLIGEVVTYRIQIDLPGGTSRQVRLQDTIPAGLELIPGSTRLALAARRPGDIASSAVPDAIAYAVQADGDNTSVRATKPWADDGSGRWAFGDLSNVDTSDESTESLILEFDAVVLNQPANGSGEVISENRVELTAANRTGEFKLNATSDLLRIQEPVLNLTKSSDLVCLNPFRENGPDVVTYKLEFSNEGEAAAFDLILEDQLPIANNSAGLVLDPDSIFLSDSNLQIEIIDDHQIRLRVDQLDPNQSMSVMYQASLSDRPGTPGSPDEPDGVLANQAKLTYTSLPGEQGSKGLTPGESGAFNGERNGSGDDPNVYADVQTLEVNVSPHVISDGPVVVNEDALPAGGAEGPNMAYKSDSKNTLRLFAGSFSLNQAALVHNGTTTPLDQTVQDLQGITITDANGSVLARGPNGQPLIWNYSNGLLTAEAGGQTLLEVQFPKAPSIQPGGVEDFSIKTRLLYAMTTHSLADNDYSQPNLTGTPPWSGALKIDGLQLALDERNADENVHCNDLLIPLNLWVLDDEPVAPIESDEPVEICAGSKPVSGQIIVEPGADRGKAYVLLDADGDGNFEQRRQVLKRETGHRVKFKPTFIPGLGVLELVADGRSGAGRWTFSPEPGSLSGTHTFGIAVEDGDGDRVHANQSLILASEPSLVPGSTSNLELNEDALPGAGSEHGAVASVGTQDSLDLQLISGSTATRSVAFNSARLDEIRASSAALLDPVSADLFSFTVKSSVQKNDTLLVRWDGRTLARLRVEPLSKPIAAEQVGSVRLKAELLDALPSHLVRYQDSAYTPLTFSHLPLQLDLESGCSSSLAVSLTVHDDRPDLSLLNDAGLLVSAVSANSIVEGSWGDATAQGGFAAAVGADRSSYPNADFKNAADWFVFAGKDSTPYTSRQAAKGIRIVSETKQNLGTLFVDDGSWRFESGSRIRHQEEFHFHLVVVDADGDRQKVGHSISVESATAPQMRAPELIVDENDLPDGNGQGPNGDVSDRDRKNVQLRARTSEISSLTFVNGDPSAKKQFSSPVVTDANGRVISGLDWKRSNSGRTLTGGYSNLAVIRLSLPKSVNVPAGTGKKVPMDVVLLDEVRHHLNPDDSYSIRQQLNSDVSSGLRHYIGDISITGITIKASADNGQYTTAQSDVLILDDMPAPLNLSGDDQICAGGTAPLEGRFNFDPGADAEGASVLISSGDHQLRLDAATTSGFLWADAVGRLDVELDFANQLGRWSFSPDPGLKVSQTLSFDLTVEDHDGDRRHDSHQVVVTPPPSIEQRPDRQQLVLNEDALAVTNVGPDSLYTSRFDNSADGGAALTLTVLNGDARRERLRFDATRLSEIQVSSAPGLSFATVDNGSRLEIRQARRGSTGKDRLVAALSVGELKAGDDPGGPTVDLQAELFSNLISHTAPDADDNFDPVRLKSIPLTLAAADQSCAMVDTTIDLEIYDDAPMVGVMDLPSDPESEQRQRTTLSGRSTVDLDTESVLRAGGQVLGSWGVFRSNNGGFGDQSAAGLAPASGADGLADGPMLPGENRWELWVDLNADGQEQDGERFDASDAADLIDSGPDSGLPVPGFGRFKFWDSDERQPGGWAFKAFDQAEQGSFEFEVNVWDGDGDQDQQKHTIVIDENPPLQQRPDVNLYLLMDHSLSMNEPDPSTADAKDNTRLEAQNRLAFLTLEKALQEAGYALQSKNGLIYDFDDNVISEIFETGAESLAETLRDFEFVDHPGDGQVPGVVNVHAIRYGYVVTHESATFTNTSTQDGKVVAEDLLLTETPDKVYGNSIKGNKVWANRGLPQPSKSLDRYVDPVTGRSNLYAGTEMLGALQGASHLLEEQLKVTPENSGSMTLMALFTDGRPERRPWWDNRPDFESDGVNIPLPKSLGGDAILSSGLGYNRKGKPRSVLTKAGVDQWSFTQRNLNANLDRLAQRSLNPDKQVQVMSVGFGDDSTAADRTIYSDLFTNQTFDNSTGGWYYNVLPSSSIIPFSG